MTNGRGRRLSASKRMLPALGLAVLCWLAGPTPASAQFSWFGQKTSAEDAYETIASHGFRLAGPLMQNRDVYIADVIDRRQRRQRLIISRDNGQIVQRYFVDVGRRGAPYAALPDGTSAPRARGDSDFFSRLVRGFGDDGPPRPPADVDQSNRAEAVEPRTLPRPDRVTKPRSTDIEPRLATRRDDAPVTSRPLAPEPATPANTPPAAPSPKPVPATTAVPASPPADQPVVATPAPATLAPASTHRPVPRL